MPVKKTILVLFSILCLSLATGIVIVADEVIIKADNLNVRTKPGTAYDTITQVHEDDVYPIIQVKDDWIEIEVDNESGWIFNEYATIKDTDPTNSDSDADETTEELPSSITITTDQTHLRGGPSTDHDIIAFVNKDETFEVRSQSGQWYEIMYKDDKAYIYKGLIDKSTQNSSHILRDKTIVVDAGHGGHDVGAISVNGEYEKDITDRTARELEKELSRLGANVILTRPMNQYIYLSGRASLANLHQADAFISIHYNSFPDSTSVTGINTYYYADQDKTLAQDIQEELIISSEADDRDIAFGNYQVLRQTSVPSLLLELGFISNEETEQLLLTSSYQNKLVTGIINGLIKNMR